MLSLSASILGSGRIKKYSRLGTQSIERLFGNIKRLCFNDLRKDKFSNSLLRVIEFREYRSIRERSLDKD